METPFKVILPDGTIQDHSAKLDPQPAYEALRDLISPHLDGGRLEHVTVLHEGERADMFVDEDFLEKRLPFNAEATAIYRANALSWSPDVLAENLPAILGPAVLFSRRVWF